MGASTKWYVKVPRVTYEWVETYAVTSEDARETHPEALEVRHWSEHEQAEEGPEMCPNCVTPWMCNGPHLTPNAGHKPRA